MTIPDLLGREEVSGSSNASSAATGPQPRIATEAEPSGPSGAVTHRAGSAIISDCGAYRYRLERHALSGAGAVAWIMVNPSTADAREDDPTIRKVIGFSERMGAGWLIVGNVFGYRATDVKRLAGVYDPHGPENDAHLRWIMEDADKVVVAWGPTTKLPKLLRHRYMRVVRIADALGRPLLCFGTAQDGHPRHPLMLAYDTPLIEWKRP